MVNIELEVINDISIKTLAIYHIKKNIKLI
jgi:hypothetical protein